MNIYLLILIVIMNILGVISFIMKYVETYDIPLQQKKFRQTLEDMKEISDNNKIPFHLYRDTALGVIREQRFIPHNKENFSNESNKKIKTLTEEEKQTLRKGQLIMTDMLKELDKICREYGLKYWCVAGTLIGVMRHKGWIPHDADIDIGILEKDYKKLKIIIQDKLPNKYWFQDKTIDSNYKSNIGKIRYLDAYYSDDNSKLWHNGIQLDFFIFKEKNDLLVPINPINDIQTINRNKIFPLKELPFEDLIVYVPNQYKKYSKNAWGDYPPPILPKSQQYPHEGRITFGTPQWMKDKYPYLYKNQ